MPKPKCNPLAPMTVPELAVLLAGKKGGPAAEEVIKRHLTLGAPASRGKIKLASYAAWLASQLGRK